MHSFFVDTIGDPGTIIELEKSERDHLFKILRAREGEVVRLLDGRGTVGDAIVESGRVLAVTARRVLPPEPLQLVIACAAPRRVKLDGMLKELTEVGVAEIALMSCVRSVAQPEGNPERWTTLLREACKQSGNPFLPRIGNVGKFPAFVAAMRQEKAALYYGAVTDPGRRPAVPARGKVVFFVGPEGGFAPEEEALLEEVGAQGISLGPWILRLETAALGGAVALRTLAQ